jgi:hypothetical protein
VRSRQYTDDVLAPRARKPVPPPQVAAENGLVVEDGAAEFCGAVIACEKDAVTLEDRYGKRRVFPLTGTFLLEGRRVTLVRPAPARGLDPDRTASGSVAVPAARAEYLGGIDDLPAIAAQFAADGDRRLGVLVDHLVAGSKESRIAAAVTSAHVLVVGHPFVDVWAAVKPAAVGLTAWPSVPRGVAWKDGILAAIGWPPDAAAAWRRILGRVQSYADLEPAFLGRVEELIDFVTAPGSR